MKALATNRRATFDYQIADRLVAGIVLSGNETKSVRAGHASLKGAYVMLRGGEAWLHGAHITPYQGAGEPDPTRTRKLLLHQRQLRDLEKRKQGGDSLVPLTFLADGRYLKLEIGIGRGKKRYDKRQAIKERDTSREVARQVHRPTK